MRLLTPARSAMLSTRAPSYPRSVNSFTAATRIAALVDSGSRVFAVRAGVVLPRLRVFGPLAGDGGLGIVMVLDFEKRSRLPYILLPPLSQRRKTGRFTGQSRSGGRS